MYIFVSYKYTAVALERLNVTVVPLVDKLRKMGNTVFCNLEKIDIYTKEEWSISRIMLDCFAELDHVTYHITFVAPDTVMGEGMLIELGYATKIGIPTLLLIPKNTKSISARAVAKNTIEYQSMDELFLELDKFFG